MKSKWIQAILTFGLTYLILAFCLGKGLWQPNNFVYAFGGDAAIIYYNMIFHSWYGQGLHLSNMNYPIGESLLMTDAQASLAYILSKFKNVSFVQNNIVGIIHSFHYFCSGIAAVFAQRALRKTDVTVVLSIVGTLVLIFLSPQLFRLRAGHFGLAYPMVFTAGLYAWASFRKEQRITPALIFGAVLLFFGINNIYLLILAGGWAVLFAGLEWMINKNKSFVFVVASSLMAIVITYILMKGSEVDMDRLVVQWGYYANRSTLEGLTYPFTSLIGFLSEKPKTNIEPVSNLGLANLICTVLVLYGWIRNRFFNKTNNINFFETKTLLWSALLMWIYASGSLKFLAEAIPAATMFKASGRFAWPLYYALSFSSIVLISKWSQLVKAKGVSVRKVLLISLMSLWVLETSVYLTYQVKFKQYENHYGNEKLKSLQDELAPLSIDQDSYQAIYSLPVMVAWNDKYRFESPWNTEYFSTRVSMVTGVPLLNAKLSRLGITRASQTTQFASHPWITKEILTGLNKSKPILLVLGKGHQLTEGEQWLIDQAEVIHSAKAYSLYALDLKNVFQPNPLVCSNAKAIYYDGYDTNDESKALYGKGHLVVNDKEGKSILFESSVVDWSKEEVEVSLWVYTDEKKYGMPWLEVLQFDAENKQLERTYYDIASSKNIVENWRRAGVDITLKPKSAKIQISLDRLNQSFNIDEFMIRATSDTVCVKKVGMANKISINNYVQIKDY